MSESISRRLFVAGSAAVFASGQTRMPVREAFDHLLLGISDLDQGIDWVERRTGVRAVAGGVHPGAGTRNALLSLGGRHYLEIIAPDPAQASAEGRAQLVRALAQPRLIGFAIATNNIGLTAASLRKAGLRVIGPTDGSRRTPSGALLRWKVLGVESELHAGTVDPIPFFIEWASDSTHPSKDAPVGCRIEELRLEHPRPDELARLFRTMDLDANIAQADQVRIIAALQTKNGRVELL
jgi:Glyoxalase-like domain